MAILHNTALRCLDCTGIPAIYDTIYVLFGRPVVIYVLSDLGSAIMSVLMKQGFGIGTIVSSACPLLVGMVAMVTTQ
jgi:hypothetical protein